MMKPTNQPERAIRDLLSLINFPDIFRFSQFCTFVYCLKITSFLTKKTANPNKKKEKFHMQNLRKESRNVKCGKNIRQWIRFIRRELSFLPALFLWLFKRTRDRLLSEHCNYRPRQLQNSLWSRASYLNPGIFSSVLAETTLSLSQSTLLSIFLFFFFSLSFRARK